MTLTEILTAVQANHSRDDRETAARTGVTLALSELVKQFEFRSMKMVSDVVVGPEDGRVALPDGILNLYEVRFMNGLQSYKLEFSNRERVLRDYPDADTLSANRPVLAYVEGDWLYFAPRTSIDAGIRFTYTSAPSFASDDDALSPSVTGLDLYLIAYATSWVFMSLQMFREASTWMGAAMQALGSAIALENRQPANEHLKENVRVQKPVILDPNDPFNGIQEVQMGYTSWDQ